MSSLAATSPTATTTNNDEGSESSSKTTSSSSITWTKSNDALFSHIEQEHFQTSKTFGSLLDAGTGLHSLTWIASLENQSLLSEWNAITADETMRSNVQTQADELNLKMGKVVIGNWATADLDSSKISTVSCYYDLLLKYVLAFPQELEPVPIQKKYYKH